MLKSYINKIHYLFFSLCQFPIKGHNFLIKTRKEESTVRLTAKQLSMLTVLACICFEFFYTVSHLLLDVRQNAPLRTWRPRPLPLWLVCGTSWWPSDPVVLSSLSVYLHTWRTDTEEERKKEVEEEEAAWRIRPTPTHVTFLVPAQTGKPHHKQHEWGEFSFSVLHLYHRGNGCCTPDLDSQK